METTKNTTEETVVTEKIVENTEVVMPPDNPKKALKEKLKQSFITIMIVSLNRIQTYL